MKTLQSESINGKHTNDTMGTMEQSVCLSVSWTYPWNYSTDS